ncbi:nuclear transport factor 2 family protein [Tetragenococcus halophilus]|uniref:Uncharacterized protein n=6 Tax=Tetragenococcus halophilus TaxID=51669 RepID=A0A2H6DCH5_TETHA|nr:nuclear transport factor 2 family protein [Tetragenococcus halophilus]MCF1601173.1 nuclear transport factor 2 family protein [Tetragenococcus halophilus]MCO7025575.1 nuclear transport factor 2 family protein [Tetragenococcus halophilus]MCO8284878.1 nuclear transport factor 2 family protein [Tetragenococcus halophilus]MCO8285722.1 nuclear transport factor 2 family protein [Tetragenococcus halophilus]MCO8287803.1 nuclear transport factor 2 family protein [Tetragenococcus halophilus]
MNSSLAKEADLETIANFYTEEFIAANPTGVKTGENNDQLKEAMDKGYEYYRLIGTKEMKCQSIDTIPLDEQHAVATTHWKAVYLKEEKEIVIPFTSNYLIQFREGQPKIFGWVTGDETQVLKEHGII